MFDWTEIVVALIALAAALLGGLMTWVVRKYVQPYLQEKGLYETAEIVVGAVEAILGRHLGEEKWALAIEKMEERGFDVENAVVLDALRAAWKKLDLSQMLAGEKEKPPEMGVN